MNENGRTDMEPDEAEAAGTGRAQDRDPQSTHVDPLRRGSAESRGRRDDLSAAEAMFEVGDLVGGRYRVIRYLAAGGMGVVFEAEDEEIGGRVALKAIQPGASSVADAVERFRREIQLARRVTHANVCRLFDVGHHARDGGDEVLFLTMELLDGETLSSRIRRDGPMSTAEALPIVRQVVAGLQAAHDAGIIHRDLKAANVMLVPGRASTRAVVTDFGLSRSFLADEPDRSLTQSGFLIGTPAYIAPEQLEGQSPSPASDIYALGLLLYEMVAGCLPFAGSSPFVLAVQRLKDEPFTPRVHVPDLDPRWERAIVRCLDRDPSRRFSAPRELLAELERPLDTETTLPTLELASPSAPVEAAAEPSEEVPVGRGTWRRWAIAGGVALAAALLAGRTIWFPRSPVRVAVLAPVLEGAAPAEAGAEIGGTVEMAVQRAVLSLDGLRALDASEVADPTAADVELARASAADELLRTQIEPSGEEWRVRLRRLDGRDGALLWTDEVRIPKGDPRTAANAIAARLRAAYPSLRVRPGSDLQEVSAEDYAEYLRLARVVDSGKAESWPEVLDGLARVRWSSPRFVDIHLYEARLAHYLFRTTGDRDLLQQAYDRLDEAHRLSGSDPRPLQREIEYAVVAGDTERAREALGQLAQVAPGEVELLQAQSLLAEAEGDSVKAIGRLDEAVRRRPSWRLLIELAKLQQRTGDVAGARRTFEQAIDLTPGTDALFGLAEVELLYGDLSRAEELFADLAQRHPEKVAYQGNLGVAQLLGGRYGAAAETFGRTLEIAPGYLVARLNFADALVLGGDVEGARAEYQRVVDGVSAEAPVLTSHLRPKSQALAHLGRRLEAVQCVQELLRREPDDGQSHFAAALVYATIGDQTAAVFHARRALELGIERRWMELPFLEAIRDDPAIAPWLGDEAQSAAAPR